MNLYHRDLISTQEWTKEDLKIVLRLATKLKQCRFNLTYNNILAGKSLLMVFYNPSLRTRISFECAAEELGGHAQFLEPRSFRLKTSNKAGETIEDAARVMSRYGAGIGIRILEDEIGYYGEGDQIIREYAHWACIPIISLAHDKYHPCQALADVMGWAEWWGESIGQDIDINVLHGKKLLMTWGHGGLARSWGSIQDSLLIASRFGMDITLAHPKGYDLDPKIIECVKTNCVENNRTFNETTDPVRGYKGAHVVYSRHWVSPLAYKNNKFQRKTEIQKAMGYPEWICDIKRMKLTENAIFTHPMPIDRGHEVDNKVASSDRSCIYDVAENRLHVQKAIMALTMGGYAE
jgi:N-acetylornithine carbamoyltransferase